MRIKFREFVDDTTASILLVLPVTLAFLLVAVIMGASKLGIEMPSILQQPVFQVWIIICGVVIAFCLWMRQIFLMMGIILISGIAVTGYYVMYVL